MSTLKCIYYGLLAISLITLLFNLRRLERVYWWFIPLLVLAILTQVSQEIINWEVEADHKIYYIFHIYQPIEYALLGGFFHSIIQNRFIRISILVSIVLFTGFCIYHYTVYPNSFSGPDFRNFTIEAILISIWVIIFFTQLFISYPQERLINYPAFWINTGNLFFYAGCIFTMAFYFYLHKTDKKLAEQLISINHYLNLLLYILYTIGFTCQRITK